MRLHEILATVVCINIFLHTAFGDKYFLKAAKNVPRIGRSSSNKNTNIDEMGKFFMKASKSVPRIGRRNENLEYGQAAEKRDQTGPIWSDIADRFEYEPDLLTSPEILEQLEMGDDPSAYDWDQVRTKRDNYKKHQKFQYLM